jgi:hypothetical protein
MHENPLNYQRRKGVNRLREINPQLQAHHINIHGEK